MDLASQLVMNMTMGWLEHLLTDKMEHLATEIQTRRESKQAGKENLRAAMRANQEKTEACEEGLRIAISVLQ
jgi:hypothetical protein